MRSAASLLAAAAGIALAIAPLAGQQTPPRDDPYRFRTGVEVINVTATVTDASGRFVPGLRQDDFVVYEDDVPQEVIHFAAERVPVSLGIALDTSGSMVGDKIDNAEAALRRLLYDLLDPQDEIFLYRFSNSPVRLQGWTRNRDELSRILGRIAPSGGTALYDTVEEAIPLAQEGRNPRKALVIISDGNDTTSRTPAREVRQRIRESDVMVYAVGIDGDDEPAYRRTPPPRRPIPWGFPPRGRPGWPVPPPGGGNGGWTRNRNDGDRVNVLALRDMTDDSGGRTEIVREPRDLDPATANIADELSKQYFLGYASSGRKDGRWHSIRVEVRNRSYRVRARRGYVAS